MKPSARLSPFETPAAKPLPAAQGEGRLWVYTVVLILILLFLPNGMIAPLWRRMRSAFA